MSNEHCARTRFNVVLHSWVVLSFLLSGIASAEASNQTEYLKQPPKVLENAATYVDVETGTTNLERVRALVAREFPGQINDPSFYCIIHIVKWGTTAAAVEKSSWYVFGADSKWNEQHFRGARIFGSHKVGVLYVQANVPMRKVTDEFRRSLIAGGITAETVSAQLTGSFPKATSVRGAKLVAVGEYVVEQDYSAISYQIDVTPKLPAPVQNLKDVIGLLQSGEAEQLKIPTEAGALYASDIYGIVSVPSDITVTGQVKIESSGETGNLGTQAFDNEGFYWWDVSVGIPLQSYKDLELNADTGDLQPKAVSRDNLLALLNIYVKAVDTKDTRSMRINPVVGLAITKRPLDTLFVGVSIGLVQVQFLAGYKWVKPELEEGAVIDTRPKRVGSWLTGVNVPVKTVTGLFTRGS